jgi:hypothetical protein
MSRRWRWAQFASAFCSLHFKAMRLFWFWCCCLFPWPAADLGPSRWEHCGSRGGRPPPRSISGGSAQQPAQSFASNSPLALSGPRPPKRSATLTLLPSWSGDLQLAKRLLGSVGAGWASRVFYSDNGSTAIEVALKMAFRRFLLDQALLREEDTQLQVGMMGQGVAVAVLVRIRPLLI